MNCYVCGSGMNHFMTKDFEGSFQLSTVDYEKCDGCGFVVSRTHLEMSHDEWQDLNHRVHESYQGLESSPRDPRWLERLNAQRAFISELVDVSICDAGARWVDYACGDGKLVALLAPHGIHVEKYDKYMTTGKGSYLSDSELAAKPFDYIINTSVMEHYTSRNDVDAMLSNLSTTGCFLMHTLVRENIPKDPSWFYLLPVHVACHTNRSMQILFEEYGFVSSLYHVPSRLWLWFRETPDGAAQAAAKSADLHFKEAFVDYWRE